MLGRRLKRLNGRDYEGKTKGERNMNTEQLNAIKERVENTSFEKAYVKGDPWKGYEVKNDGNGQIIAELPCGTDAEFIAHAREDIPQLVAEVELLRALLRQRDRQLEGERKGSQRVNAENERLRDGIETIQERLFSVRGLNGTHDGEITGACIAIRKLLDGDDVD